MIGVSDKTVRRWMHSGKMESYCIGGRKALYTDLNQINKMRELYALPTLTVDESVVIYKNY